MVEDTGFLLPFVGSNVDVPRVQTKRYGMPSRSLRNSRRAKEWQNANTADAADSRKEFLFVLRGESRIAWDLDAEVQRVYLE